MTEQAQQSEMPPEVSAFLEATEGFRSAMVPSLSFLAFRRDGRWEIFRSRFALNLPIVALEPISVKTENILAGFELIDRDSGALKRFVEAILGGKVEIGSETLHFPVNFGGDYSAIFVPLHTDGIAHQNRTAVLQILGNEQRGYLSYAPLDWELRAATAPYESVADLISHLGLPSLPHVGALFEAIAFSFIAIDSVSRVEETSALFRLRLCQGLDHSKASIGYRVLSQAAPPSRGRIDGASLSWSDVDGVDFGEASLEVPPAALIHAYACYDGVAYQHWWFSDPSHSQNPRRAAYESSDKGLESLQIYLRNGGKQSRDLEAAVSWLLWMLGFNPIHLGALPRMSDAADVLVTTPQGHFAVVECTTGVLKADHKLTHLVNRTAAVRTQLAQSNYPQLRVLPVILTTKTREEVQADLEQARQLGVVVVCQDDVSQLIARTLLMPDADAIYTEAEDTLRGAEEIVTEPGLPLG